MNILFIAPYPDEFNPHQNVFVYNLVQGLNKMGINIEVISPVIWWRNRAQKITEPGEKEYGQERSRVIRPRMFYFFNRIRIGDYSMGRLNSFTYSRSVKSVFNKLQFKPDIVYAHFLYMAGPGALAAAKHFKVPAVIALGESTLDRHKKVYSQKNITNLIKGFSGIISVSEVNKQYCMDELGMSEERIEVIPNAVDKDLFYPRNKDLMRKKYNLPQDKFIISFVGNFIDRKGPLRVLAALEELPNDIGGIFIGAGPQRPLGDKVLFADSVPHEQVPELLSASDVFVLPTMNEGSCNSIAEAMSCGLPIISSNIPAIKEQVEEQNSILCDPQDINQIKKAIKKVYQNKNLLNSMSQASLQQSSEKSLSSRAAHIYSYLKKIRALK